MLGPRGRSPRKGGRLIDASWYIGTIRTSRTGAERGAEALWNHRRSGDQGGPALSAAAHPRYTRNTRRSARTTRRAATTRRLEEIRLGATRREELRRGTVRPATGTPRARSVRDGRATARSSRPRGLGMGWNRSPPRPRPLRRPTSQFWRGGPCVARRTRLTRQPRSNHS